jgi:hypothetical protein
MLPRFHRLRQKEATMQSISTVKCIYDTNNRGWAIEIALGEEGEKKRFDVAGAEDAEQFIEAFDEATQATFDPASGEIHFSYEYAMDDEESDDEDDAQSEGEDSENGEEDGEEEEDEGEDQRPAARQ